MAGCNRLMKTISTIYFSLNCIVILISNTHYFHKERKYVYDINVLYTLARLNPFGFKSAARFSRRRCERYYLYVTHPLVLVESSL